MPLAVLAGWFIDSPDRPISLKRALTWVLFPTTYVFYSLVRGALMNWYPYPFLNPNEQGYERIVITCAVMLVAVIGLTALLAASTRSGKIKRQSV